MSILEESSDNEFNWALTEQRTSKESSDTMTSETSDVTHFYVAQCVNI